MLVPQLDLRFAVNCKLRVVGAKARRGHCASVLKCLCGSYLLSWHKQTSFSCCLFVARPGWKFVAPPTVALNVVTGMEWFQIFPLLCCGYCSHLTQSKGLTHRLNHAASHSKWYAQGTLKLHEEDSCCHLFCAAILNCIYFRLYVLFFIWDIQACVMQSKLNLMLLVTLTFVFTTGFTSTHCVL